MGSKFFEKKVKDLAAKKSNKECFDCGKKGVQGNVNLTHYTFICTRCAGLHRSLGHVAKSIGMHNFTKEQHDGLESGGNKKAHKYWMGKLPEEFKRPDQNEAKMVEFMKWVYVEKKFIKKDGDVKSAQKKKVVHKPPTAKKSVDVAGSQVPTASPAPSDTSTFSRSEQSSSHVSQDTEEDNNENEGGGVDLLTDFEITEVPSKGVQGDKGGQQSHDDGDSFSDPPASLGESEERDVLGSSSRSHTGSSSINRGAIDKLAFVLKNIRTEFNLSHSDLENAVEAALRQLSSQSIVPSQSASSVDSGEDEGNPFEDEEEQPQQRSSPPAQSTSTPAVRSTSKPSLTSSTPSSISLFPDLMADTPSSSHTSTPISYPQVSHPQPQQHHQPYPQYQQQQQQQQYQQQQQQYQQQGGGYGKPGVPQGGFGYGQPYSYGGFPGGPGGPVGPYGPGTGGPGFQPIGGQGVGGFQNGFGTTGSYQQQQQPQVPAKPDLFAGLDPFA